MSQFVNQLISKSTNWQIDKSAHRLIDKLAHRQIIFIVATASAAGTGFSFLPIRA